LKELGGEAAVTTDRGEALTFMTKAVAVFIRKLYQNIRFDGIIGAGKYPSSHLP